MKLKLCLPCFVMSLAFASAGCSSAPPEPSAQEKKDFMGAPMPKDFAAKNGMAGGPAAAGQAQGEDIAKKAAAEAAAKNAHK